MQNVITWEQFLICLLVFLLIYYVIVLALYYRDDLGKLGKRFGKQDGANAMYKKGNSSIPREKHEYESLYDSVHELMKECRGVFSNTNNAPIDRGKLIADLSDKVKAFPQIKGTAFQISMSNHFAQEASHRLGVELNDNELEEIWQ
ncbi:hypothetical protein [Niabella beijingensis]|uniref:hypothetical protein n=1 Tax=Niabella beijingensis TaxID=2872700 RepID=UPI001CC1B933|nr:hypothetical protein [Niabella beijingensis]MBZ4187622.1 hypothetical protein [Niabella beijingensis]